MRNRVFAALLAAAVGGAVGACSKAPAPTQPAAVTVPVQFATATGADAGASDNHRTHLTGDAERPTPNDSTAQGQAVFQVNADGSAIHYQLLVGNIENVTQAHIHCCATPKGPAESWCGSIPAPRRRSSFPGRSQGVLGEGLITQSSLVGGLAGQPLSVLLDQIASGLAYVNVHTSQFQPGEIRGQIR